MIEKKPKKCKGIGKAYGFEGCGIETLYREHGLCDSCKVSWWFNDERGEIDYATQKNALNKSNWKEQKKVLKEKVKTLSDYEAEAKKSFQKWVRLRDENLPCISCGTTKDVEYAGGHYFKAEIYSGLIFDERNCNKQCNAYCNKYRDGAQAEYRIGLAERYGKDFVEQLEADSIIKRQYKFSKSELIEIKQKYDLKIKEFN